MKRIALIMFTLATICANAQEIGLDKTFENGGRIIIAELESLRSFTDKVIFECALSYGMNDDTENWDIILQMTSYTPIEIPKDSRLLIQLKDDSTLMLRSDVSDSDDIGSLQKAGSSLVNTHTIAPVYPVTESQIEQISKGVKKIRVETSLDAIDKEFKKDKMGKIIAGQYELIKEQSKSNNNFIEGF